MTISFQANTLVVDGHPMQMPWLVLDAVEQSDKVIVLLDPDSYLLDPNYKQVRRRGGAAIKNLLAIDKTGAKLWEAELPEQADYYYRIGSASPLTANSFSSYRCEIDANTGSIRSKEFLK